MFVIMLEIEFDHSKNEGEKYYMPFRNGHDMSITKGNGLNRHDNRSLQHKRYPLNSFNFSFQCKIQYLFY